MAAPTVKQIRDGLIAKLSVIPDVQWSPYWLAAPTPPAGHVFPDVVEYDQAMSRGHHDWTWGVQVFVGLTTDRGAQTRLDMMLDPGGATSVKEALETADTPEGRVSLGGLIDDLHVTGATGHSLFVLPQARAPVIGCEWTVSLIVPGQ